MTLNFNTVRIVEVYRQRFEGAECDHCKSHHRGVSHFVVRSRGPKPPRGRIGAETTTQFACSRECGDALVTQQRVRLALRHGTPPDTLRYEMFPDEEEPNP